MKVEQYHCRTEDGQVLCSDATVFCAIRHFMRNLRKLPRTYEEFQAAINAVNFSGKAKFERILRPENTVASAAAKCGAPADQLIRENNLEPQTVLAGQIIFENEPQ